MYAGVFIMFNEFSFVMEDEFGFSEFYVGLLCGLIVAGLLVGSIISVILVRWFDPIRVVEMGMKCIFKKKKIKIIIFFFFCILLKKKKKKKRNISDGHLWWCINCSIISF